MTMAVHHRLTCRHAGIEPDVITGWLEILFNNFFALIDQCKHSLLLLNRHREKIRNMPERNYEQVPPADRVAVPAGITEIVLRYDLISEGIAKCSGQGRLHASNPRSTKKLLYTLPHKHWSDTGMTAIPRKYITDAKNQKQAVIVDLETFNRMESIIEDNGLAKFMEEAEEDEILFCAEAKKHYRSLKKD
jgi:hypothetical protein